MKKLISALLVALLVLSCVPAVVVADEEIPTLSVWSLFTHVAGDDNYVEKYLEEKLGIDLIINTTPSTEGEAVNLMLASGDMPDCLSINKTYNYMFVENELTQSFPLDMVREYAPGLTAVMDEEPILYALTQDPEDENAMYCLPDMYDTYSEMYPSAIFLRYDWIVDLGIDLGDVEIEQLTDNLYISDKGITRDVFTEILTKFVYDDPDGNGVADTFGVVDAWTRLTTAFGLTTSTNMEYDGHVIEWFTHPNCKDLLAYMKELNDAGLLHPELFTLVWGTNWEMLKNDQAGVMLSGSTHYLNSWCTGRWPYAVLNGEAEAQDVLMIPGILDDNGNNVCSFYIGKGFNGGNGLFYANADIDEDKLALAIKYYDLLHFSGDPEIDATVLMGEKDVDWAWDEDGVTPVKINVMAMGERGTQSLSLPVQIGNRWRWETYEHDFALGEKYYIKSAGGLWNKDLVVDYKKDLFNETNAASVSSEYSADWGLIRDNYFIAVINGEKNLEEDWDAYIAELNDAHYDEYIAELDKAPVVQDVVDQYSK